MRFKLKFNVTVCTREFYYALLDLGHLELRVLFLYIFLNA